MRGPLDNSGGKVYNDYFLYLLKSDGKSCCNFFFASKTSKKTLQFDFPSLFKRFRM